LDFWLENSSGRKKPIKKVVEIIAIANNFSALFLIEKEKLLYAKKYFIITSFHHLK
jgi:hypothetical protein